MDRDSADVKTVKHLIVGAGFAGLGAAIKLQEDGESDFVVIEKGPDVGGTWRDNTYPGATCDVPSQLYSFSFASYDWPNSYSPQPDIQAYIKRRRRRVRDARPVRLRHRRRGRRVGRRGAALAGADLGRWPGSAQFLIVGAGGLSAPKLPEIDGIETFQGELFHSARWDHDVDLTGKRVAVIGTGASAIQIVPELQKTGSCGHLDVYQRTAPWIIPRNDRPYGRLERAALRRVPGLQRLYRTGLYWAHEAYVPAFTLQPKLAAPARKVALGNIRKGIKDPELRAKVTPNFDFGCKRVLRSNDYYPALDADNTDLVTDPIAKVTGNAIVTADGVEREIDVLVVATGFYTTELPITEHVTGRSGQTLAERWRATGMAAYKGTTIPDFPNLFLLVGPNTGQGHTSMIFIIESQIAYVRDAIRTMNERGHREHRADPGGHRRLEPQPAEADEPHRVDHRRLPELVPRRPRPQHHAVAQVHRRLPAPTGVVRRRRLPGDSPDGRRAQ